VAGSMVWVSTELLALSVLAVTTPAVVLLAIERTRPSVVLDRCRHAWRALAIAAAAALVVSLPFWSQFVGGSEKVPELYHDRQQHLFGLRLDNLFVPIDSAWPRRLVGLGLDGDLGPLPAEAVGYLSIAGVAAACVVTVAHRSGDRRLRFAILGFWCSLILGLGRSFNAGDGHWGWLPWRIVDRLPLIGDAIPNRLALFTFLYLVVALLLVVDLPATPRLARWGKALIVAMAVFVVPVMPFDVERLDVEVADAIVATCADADVLVVPRDLGFGVFVGPRSMAWQAEAGMRFGLIRGWAFRESSPAEGPPFALDQLVGDDGRGSVERANEELEALAPVCVVAPEAGDDALQRTIQQPPVVQSGWRIWHVK